jgi:AcrR family transcriptional regulator
MNRKRLTREDSRERTTQRLLAAAQKLIARRGLGATTLDDIAGEAGYTRGAFYSNFGSKGELFIELLRRDHEATSAQLRALRDDSLRLEHIQQRIREIYDQMYRTNETFMNWTEARMLAARDTKFQARLDALLLERRTEAAELIEYLYGRVGIAPPLAPTAVAMGVNSLFEGVKLTMLSSPGDMTSDDAESVLALFVNTLTRAARTQGEKNKPEGGEGGSPWGDLIHE